MSLCFYRTERERFPEESKMMVVSQSLIRKIVRKLCRHYKLPPPTVVFEPHLRSKSGYHRHVPHVFMADESILAYHPAGVSFLVLAHEVAHYWQHHKTWKTHHSGKLLTLIKRLIVYSRKHGYWGADTVVAHVLDLVPAKKRKVIRAEREKARVRRLALGRIRELGLTCTTGRYCGETLIDVAVPPGKMFGDGCESYTCHGWVDVLERLKRVQVVSVQEATAE